MRRRSGSALVELALVLAVFSPMVAGGLRFAYSFYLIHGLQRSVAMAAEYGSGLEFADAAAFESAVRARALEGEVPRLRAEHVRVEVEQGPDERPRWVTVSVEGYGLPTPFSTTRLAGKPRARFPYRRR